MKKYRKEKETATIMAKLIDWHSDKDVEFSSREERLISVGDFGDLGLLYKGDKNDIIKTERCSSPYKDKKSRPHATHKDNKFTYKPWRLTCK